MNSHIDNLVRQYRTRGVLVDTNLLLLYFVGSADSRHVTRFKRTRQYTEDDFRILAGFLALFPTLATLPNILTEVSNLIAPLMKGQHHISLNPTKAILFHFYNKKLIQP